MVYHVLRSAFHRNVYRARQRHFDLCVTVKQVASDAWDLLNVLDQPLHRARLQSVVAFAFHKVTATLDADNHMVEFSERGSWTFNVVTFDQGQLATNGFH